MIALGIAAILAGIVLMFWDRLPFSRLPLGNLPGDINIKKPGFSFSFPIVTCLVISVVLSLILSFFRK